MNGEVSVRPAAEDEAPVLGRLFQLYVYDFSPMLGLDLGDDGGFSVPDLTVYWREPGRHPYLIRAGGKLAGFALVLERSRLTGAAGVRDMAEFFVVRRYRGQGVGARAAHALFALWPGPWEIRQRSANTAATAFWRRAIASFGPGTFREQIWADASWQGPVQFFTA